MIISKTPYRISFFGGGTDYPSWYRKNGGRVISTSIDKHVYITCRYLPPFFDHRIRVVYSIIDQAQNLNQIKHPVVKEVLKYLNIEKDIEIHYDGDLPSKSGIGSSSAFTAGLLNALIHFKGLNITKKKLGENTIYIEQKKIKEIVGSQDQIAVANGGFNLIKFKKNGKIIINPINISSKNLQHFEKKFMLFHTGIFRVAQDIAKTFVTKFDVKSEYLHKIDSLVDDALQYLKNNNYDDFGNLLNQTWELKKKIGSKISNKKIDDIYNKAIKCGALGGKLLGAGGGGLIIFYVPSDKQQKLKKALSDLLYIPFKFDFEGSKIIYKSIEKKYPLEEKIRSSSRFKVFK